MTDIVPVPFADVPGSPDWWMRRLLRRLYDQAQQADRLDAYYRNEQVLPPMCDTVRQSYQRLMAMSRTNYAELIVEAVRERMKVVGFRTGATDDPMGDREAWRLWQANGLDADSSLVHRASLNMAASFVIVGKDGDEVLITPEDPRQVTAEMDPVRRRKPRAALKVFRDEVAGVERLYLYLPGRVYTAHREVPDEFMGDARDLVEPSWTWESLAPLAGGAGDVVPVVPFLNRADLFMSPDGEFESHLGLLDRINYGILQRLEIATLQAFRQRALRGAPPNDEFGNPVDYNDIFSADPGAMWLLPETAELWESGQVDLSPHLRATEADVQQLAAVTRTPMQYFAPAQANQSAESSEAAREALINKTRDRLTQAGEAWEQVMALAFTFAGDETRAQRSDMEVIWADPENYTLAEKADAAAKAEAGGLTWRAKMEMIWQLTPQQIDRMEAERFSDAIAASLSLPPASPGAPQAPGEAAPGTTPAPQPAEPVEEPLAGA
jgi:hypothetical protein